MTTIRKWWYDGGNFKNVPNDEQYQAILTGLKEIEDACDLKFEQVSERHQAQIRMWWDPSLKSSLGKHSGGNIRLNPHRDFGYKSGYPRTRYAVTATMHEFVHALIGSWHNNTPGYDGDLSNDPNRWCMMHSWLGYYICPECYIRLQNRFGKPKSTFYPPEKVYYGRLVRKHLAQWKEYKDSRKSLIEARENSTVKSERKAINDELRVLLTLQNEQHSLMHAARNQWLRLNQRFRKVPMAHYLDV